MENNQNQLNQAYLNRNSDEKSSNFFVTLFNYVFKKTEWIFSIPREGVNNVIGGFKGACG